MAALAAALDDICSRYLSNVPAEQLSDYNRLCFITEEMCWFYKDHWLAQDPTLPDLNELEFLRAVLNHLPAYREVVPYTNQIFRDFLHYKRTVPSYGAVLVNRERNKILLVKGYNRDGWTFPKGKINRTEDGLQCAIREVREEIAYDIGQLADSELYVEKVITDKLIRLYVVVGVPEDFPFQCQTHEIGECSWHSLEAVRQLIEGPEGKKHYVVQQFYKPIKAALDRYKRHKKMRAKAAKREQAAAAGTAGSAAPARQAAAPAATMVHYNMPELWKGFKFDTQAVLAAVQSGAER